MTAMSLPANEELLDRYTAVLVGLGQRHGLSGLRHGGPGTLVVEVEPGRTYLDLARFELEAEALLGAGVTVVSSDATRAREITGAPLEPPKPGPPGLPSRQEAAREVRPSLEELTAPHLPSSPAERPCLGQQPAGRCPGTVAYTRAQGMVAGG